MIQTTQRFLKFSLGIIFIVCNATPVVAVTPVTHIESPANAELDPAVRLNPPKPQLNPDGLTGCDEMNWYRKYVGLPERFDSLGYRESRCRNDVRTFCCYGYWQNYISSHLSPNSRYRNRIINECDVHGVSDIYGNLPEQKLGQACVTKVVYDISGYVPWRL